MSLLQKWVCWTFFLWAQESLYLSTLIFTVSGLAQHSCSPLEKECLEKCLMQLESPFTAQKHLASQASAFNTYRGYIKHISISQLSCLHIRRSVSTTRVQRLQDTAFSVGYLNWLPSLRRQSVPLKYSWVCFLNDMCNTILQFNREFSVR